MRLLKLLVLIVLLTPATAAAKTAPGAPGERALWTAADKDGFGTAHSTKSKVWHTLNGGELTEVYYPRLDTPALRDLQFVVSDGKTFAERETDAAEPHDRAGRQALADLPPGHHDVPLPDRQDLRGRPGAQRAARRRRLHLAHRQAARPLRARRPGALQQRQRRLRDDRRRRAARPGRERGRGARRLAGLHAHLRRLPRHERRLERPALGLPHGLGLRQRARTATSCRPAAPRSTASSARTSRWRSASARPAATPAARRAPRSTRASPAPRTATSRAGTATSAR